MPSVYHVPTLPYEYDALHPAISADIMRLHHQKHHHTYVDKLNAAIQQQPDIAHYSLEELLRNLDQLPDAVRQTVRNNAGGHYNHSLFWQCMQPVGGEGPTGQLAEAMTQNYGSFDAFRQAWTQAALGVFGSGWVWLLPNLDIVTTPNQDSPLMQGLPAPILGLDVWEHAYYLDYYNRRADYIEAWWQVVNWPYVEAQWREAQYG